MNRLAEIRRELKMVTWLEEGLAKRKEKLLSEFSELSDKLQDASRHRFLHDMNIEPLTVNEPNNPKHPRPPIRKN